LIHTIDLISISNLRGLQGAVQVQVSLAFGFMITALAFAVGHISGGHINCAVTFAFVVSGRISPLRGFFYFLGQLFGGIVGALCLKTLMPQSFWPSCFAANFVHDNATPGMAFLLELILTFFLLFVVSAATDSQKALKDMTPLAIGLCIYCAHMVGIPMTGTSINPTRTFASAVASYGVPGCENVWDYHWIFWLAPLMGGTIATYVYQFAFASAWGESLESQYRDDYAEDAYAGDESQPQLQQQGGVELAQDPAYYGDEAQQQGAGGDVQAHSFDDQQYYDDQGYGQQTPQGQAR
jgi:MIP family channel proteins